MREKVQAPEKCFDVIVCGGGPSGIMAAVAAARNGARTALIERYAFLGGMATAGLVAPISEFNKNGKRIIGGLPWEMMERMEVLGGADLSYPIGNVPYDPEIYKLVAQRMTSEAGVSLYLNCLVAGCDMDDTRIAEVHCAGLNGPFNMWGEYIIDCTGDALIASCAGVPFQEAADGGLQPATLCMRIANVDTDHLENIFAREHHTKYANMRVRAMLEGLEGRGVSVPQFGGPWFHYGMHDGIVFANMTRTQAQIGDAKTASQMECKLREDAHRLMALLREYIPEFRESYLLETAVQAGYRETRHIHGAYILTGEDILSHRRFEDAIAQTAHPIDVHRAEGTGQDVRFLEDTGFIPYGSLFAEGYPNLLVAGRCISADKQAFASIRVQAPVMAVGQAAGTAAAMCQREGVHVDRIDRVLLKERLCMQGAIL